MASDEALLRLLRKSLMVYLAESTGMACSDERIEPQLAELLSPLSKDPAPPIAGTGRTIRACKDSGRGCTLMATVAGIGNPEIVVVDGESTEVVSARLTDPEGADVPTLPVTDPDVAASLLAAGRGGQPVRIAGVVLSLPKPVVRHRGAASGGDARIGKLVVTSVERHYSHLDAMAATEAERAEAADRIDRAKGDCVDLLRDALFEQLRLVPAPGLSELLNWVILQAFGCADIGQTPGTIHVLLVGPPGQGKKIPSLAAEALHPTAAHVMPGRASLAGLMGPAVRSADGWTFEPGILARGTGGVTIMQDTQAWSQGELRELAPILQHAIEDGQVRAGGIAGGRTMTARTALLLDANRTVDVLGAGRIAPILRQLPLLSRIDLLLGIDADASASWATGAAMLAPPPAFRIRTSRPRVIPAVVATLRDRHPTIDLSEVWSPMKAGYEALFGEFEPFLVRHEEVAAALSRRMAISMQKICAAAARAADAPIARAEHADVALRAARLKLMFVRDLVVHLSKCPEGAPDIGQWIRGQAGALGPEELAERYRVETGHMVSARTVRRRLLELGCSRAGKGLYLLPASSGEQP